MKTLLKSFLCLALLATGSSMIQADDCCNQNTSGSSNDCGSSTDCNNGCNTCHTIIVPRSTGADSARELLYHFGHQYDADCFYGGFQMVGKYQDTWRECRLAKCLFGASTLNFKGSCVSGRDNSKDLIADYFGLGNNSQSSVSFSPRIQNFVVDFQLYLGLNEWWNGLYFRVNAPLTASWWSLQGNCNNNGCGTGSSCDNNNNCCPTTTTSTTTTSGLNATLNPNSAFPAGCMNTVPTTTATVAALTALNVPAVPTLAAALDGQTTFGDMTEKWKYGRFRFCKQHDTKLADVDLILGYDFWNCEDYHLGLFIQAVAPTGTRIDDCYARYVFNPVIGNGRHWELGGGLSAHYELWNCDDASLTAYLEGNVTHMFKNCQTRSFDFKTQGCMSRYMLLKEFTKDSTTGNFTYANKLINAINFTTRRANVSVDVKGDFTLQFIYRNCDWFFGLGYNFYGQSAEDVCITNATCDNSLNNRYFGFKGCAPVDAINYAATGGTTFNTPLALCGTTPIVLLNSTQSNATAYSCGTTDNSVAVTPPADCFAVSACSCVAPVAGAATTTVTAATNSTQTAATNTIINATANAADYLNANSGATPRQITNKIFGNIDYEWSDCDWKPYLGIFAEVEFASNDDCCTPNMWGVGLKGGISF